MIIAKIITHKLSNPTPYSTTTAFKLIHVPQHIQGKKTSLNLAIENSTSQIILTTAADCILSQSSILNQYSVQIQKNADLVLGLITFTGGILYLNPTKR